MENRIIQAQMNAFLNSQQIEEKDPSKQFEIFASYCAVGQHYDDTYDIFDIIVGGGNDCGMDAIAIIVNGEMITSKEEIEDIKKFFEIKFIFVQAKSSSKFDCDDIGTFGTGVRDFFSETPRMNRNEQIAEKSNIVKCIFDRANNIDPECYLYYISTGNWVDDNNCLSRINIAKDDLQNMSYFSKIEYIPVGDKLLKEFYRNITEPNEVQISFSTKISLPDNIENVKQSFLGFIDYKEYLKLIEKDNGEIRRSVFYDNVRDFLGENTVNKEIAETVVSNSDKFILFNNGVTVVCKNFSHIRNNECKLTNYQIVNGCQTSHVLFNNKDKINGDLQIPIKIIETEDSETVNQIIKATNHQTQVKNEQLIALNEFNRDLESFYASFENDDKRLYYERRVKQYSNVEDNGIKKVRIVTIATQIKSVASMFYDKPNLASRYYGEIPKQIEDIFASNHKHWPYYTAAYTLYKLECLFRNKTVPTTYKKFRFHILMMLKYRLVGSNVPRMNANQIDNICKTILDTVNDDDKFRAVVGEMTSLINGRCDINSMEITKQGSLVEDLKIVSINK